MIGLRPLIATCATLALAAFAIPMLGSCADEPKRPLGASCTNDQECESGRCVDGICVAPALSDADTSPDAETSEVVDTSDLEVATTADLVVHPRELDNDAVSRFEFVSVPSGASFECSLDGAPFVPCGSPYEFVTTEGEHTLVIRVYWPDGSAAETTITYTWRVDLTAPVTTLVAAPPAVDNGVEATFRFEISEAASASCRIDGGEWAPCASPHAVSGLGHGPHVFEVASTDAAGNIEDPPVSHRWTVDTTTPDTRIDSGPGALVAETRAVFFFSSPSGALEFECALDTDELAACTSPWEVRDLADGEHTFEVRAVNAVGEVDPTPAEWTWTVDTVEPIAGVCGPAAGGSTLDEPSAGLCAAGTPSAASGEGPFSWTCQGSAGGTTATCTANRSCDGGTLEWVSDANACSAPIAMTSHGERRVTVDASQPTTGSQTFDCLQGEWAAVGAGTCVAAARGMCGPAHGGDSIDAPTSGLCSSGTPTSVTGDGPFTWSCLGEDGGEDAPCASDRSCADESLGWEVAGVSCSAQVTTAPSGATRNATDVAEPAVGNLVFTCDQGTWEPVDAGTCDTLVPAICGGAHGGDSLDRPTEGLCALGTPTAVTGDGPFTWTCLGDSGGADADCGSDRSCAAESLTWNVDGEGCGAEVIAALDEESRTATDASEPAVGSRTFTCDQGTWQPSDSGSCAAVNDGICGAAHGGDSIERPTQGLCASGTATNVTGDGPFSWSCLGQNGGDDVGCASDRSCAGESLSWSVGGVGCGAGVTAAIDGESRTASDGTEPAVGSQTFECNQGIWGPSGAGTCDTVIHGGCGPAHGGDSVDPPSGGLCARGTPTAVTGDGPFTWSCLGQNGGDDVGCASDRSCVDESVSWASANSACEANVTAADTGQSRTASDTSEPVVGSESFLCEQGVWTVSGAGTCGTNGVCGTAHGGDSTNPPTSNLCSSGTASSVTGGGPYTWTCSGLDGGSPASCSSDRSCIGATRDWSNGNSSCSASISAAVDGGSRTANDATQPTIGSQAYLCDQGQWELSGSGTCVTNGACGSAHGGSTLGPPSTNLCSSGSASGVTGNGPFSWTCSGFDGGSAASCSSNLSCGVVDRDWQYQNNNCSATTSTSAHGATIQINDKVPFERGSQLYKCDQGAWSESGTGTCIAMFIESPSEGAQYFNLQEIPCYFGVIGNPSSVQCRVYLSGTTPAAWKDCANPFTSPITTNNTNDWIFDLRVTDGYGNDWIMSRNFWNLGN